MVSQRVLTVALGYEDVNDQEQLRLDLLLASLAGKADRRSPSPPRRRPSSPLRPNKLSLFLLMQLRIAVAEILRLAASDSRHRNGPDLMGIG